jgi:hypothetical protein
MPFMDGRWRVNLGPARLRLQVCALGSGYAGRISELTVIAEV